MSFTCPRCGKVSYHPKDEEYGYCARCHAFTGEPKPKKKEPDRLIQMALSDRWMKPYLI